MSDNCSFSVLCFCVFIPTQKTFTCSKSTIETLGKELIFAKLTITTPEQRQSSRSNVFIVNFEHILHIFLVFLLLILSKYLFVE